MARGIVGPADDLMSLAPELVSKEMEGFSALFSEDAEKALWPGGEVAGRIDDLPTVSELIERIVREAEEIILHLPEKIRR